MTTMDRPTEVCVEVVLDLFLQHKVVSRRLILGKQLLTAGETDRALKSLRDGGRIRRTEASRPLEPRLAEFELVDKRASREDSRVSHASFDGLLDAWSIRPPASSEPAAPAPKPLVVDPFHRIPGAPQADADPGNPALRRKIRR